MPQFGLTRAGKALGVHSCQRCEHECWCAGNLIFRYYVKKKKRNTPGDERLVLGCTAHVAVLVS